MQVTLSQTSLKIETVCKKFNNKKSRLNKSLTRKEKDEILTTYLNLLCKEHQVRKEAILRIVNN